MGKSHQHFIPRTYLKNFSHTNNGDTYLIDGFNKQESRPKADLSIYDVCVDTDFYTLNHLPAEKKYIIEDFFSNSVETHFPEVYKILVDDRVTEIDFRQRVKIIYTILSMYFRTPKVLNQFVTFASDLLRKEREGKNIEKVNFLGQEINLEGKTFKQIKKEIREANRINYITTQMQLLDQFVRYRLKDGIVVIKLVGKQEYVTSDNPIEIRTVSGLNFNLFDANNSIYVPLDPKHALFIAPKAEGTIVNQIFRQRDSFFQHVILNNCVFKNSERWTLGTKEGIKNFISDEKEYSTPGDENHPIIKTFKDKLEIMIQLSKLSAKGVSRDNKELTDYVNKVKDTELFKSSVEYQDIYKQLKEMGLDI